MSIAINAKPFPMCYPAPVAPVVKPSTPHNDHRRGGPGGFDTYYMGHNVIRETAGARDRKGGANSQAWPHRRPFGKYLSIGMRTNHKDSNRTARLEWGDAYAHPGEIRVAGPNEPGEPKAAGAPDCGGALQQRNRVGLPARRPLSQTLPRESGALDGHAPGQRVDVWI